LAVWLGLGAACGRDAPPTLNGQGLGPLEEPEVRHVERRPWWPLRVSHPTWLVNRQPAPFSSREPEPPRGVERVTYTSSTLTLGAWLALPDGAGPDRPRPAVVYLHGYFGLAAETWDDARRFRDAGLVVLMPMLRGENGHPGDFEMFFGEVDDAAAAARYLAARPEVDPEKVFAFGHSVGGGIAGLLALHPDAPLRETGSCGGVYAASIFNSWRNVVPFDPRDPVEIQLRLLGQNLPDMRRPHVAVVGRRDPILRYAEPVFVEAKRRGAPLSLTLVEGGHFSSLPACIEHFLEVIPGRR
jgi:acetyl esterase/lipase